MEPRPAVHSVAIELTPYCNQKCDYCYNAWREGNGASVRQATTEQLLGRVRRLLGALRIDHVTLTGGEPFARHDLFELLDLLRDAGVPAQFISNGGLVTEALAGRLAPYQPRYVQITLNGPDAALHEEHVGKGHFEKTIAGVRLLREAGVPVVGCVVVTRKNARKLGEILDLWGSLGVEYIALSRFSPAGYAATHAAALLPGRGDVIAALDQALPFARDRGFSLSVTMPIPPCTIELEAYEPIRFGVCAIGSEMQEFALGPDGRLRNCTLHRASVGADVDILDPAVDIPALLRSPDVVDYKKHVPAFCEGCVHADSCGGGCGAAADWVLGSARGMPDPFLWQHVDDEFGARLERQRGDGKRHLETIVG